MNVSFFSNNRCRLASMLPEGSLAVFFSGKAPHQSADSFFPFFADRNFLYLSGIDYPGHIITIQRLNSQVSERIYVLPQDPAKERWAGKRYTVEEIRSISGFGDGAGESSTSSEVVSSKIIDVGRWVSDIDLVLRSGQVSRLYVDLFKHREDENTSLAEKFASSVESQKYGVEILDVDVLMRKLRTIKHPEEIEAIRIAESLTRDGIVAMMKTARPGVYEYELLAAFQFALMRKNTAPAFMPIISGGNNNFFIHYEGRQGRIEDGDMVLNDVGATWQNLVTDVSRGYPVNGVFSKEQAALYNAAYRTSNTVFQEIRPGMPMIHVDQMVRRLVFTELRAIGLLKEIEEVDRYVWHGGAHHIGWDVHDKVEANIGSIEAGMVFCVDVGIYVEDWGIGFRLEDNCLVTKHGAENLSAAIPRSLKDIEDLMNCRT